MVEHEDGYCDECGAKLRAERDDVEASAVMLAMLLALGIVDIGVAGVSEGTGNDER